MHMIDILVQPAIFMSLYYTLTLPEIRFLDYYIGKWSHADISFSMLYQRSPALMLYISCASALTAAPCKTLPAVMLYLMADSPMDRSSASLFVLQCIGSTVLVAVLGYVMSKMKARTKQADLSSVELS